MVAILTLLSSGALFMLFVMNVGLLFVGGSVAGVGVNWLYVMLSYPSIPVSFILSVYAFFLSIVMFSRTSKYVWYASMLLWLTTIAFSSWWEYSVVWNYVFHYLGHFTLFPLACSIGCLIYFQTARVKDYFKIKTVNTSKPPRNLRT